MRLRNIVWVFASFAFVGLTSFAQQAGGRVALTTGLPLGKTGNTSYGKLPLVFEANQGQADPQVRFLFRGTGYTAFLTSGSMVLSLRPARVDPAQQQGNVGAASKGVRAPASTVQFRLLGAATNTAVVGEDLRPGKVNYFIGNNPTQWRTNVATYARVRYKGVYPGIDLVYYGNCRQLEYDFVISPGADPGRIEFEIQGANQIQLDENGNLVLQTPSGALHFQNPAVYQESSGRRIPVNGTYLVKDSTHVSFRVANYDPSRPLVIDPVLEYGTYLGGSGNDRATGIAVDSTGSVYVAGYTDSADFPLATLGSLPAGATHVFVTKLDASGSNLVFADYIGGNSQDYGYAMVLDSANNVYVAGSTASSDFPMVNPYQGTYPGSFNAFLTKISANGSSLLYSTYLGGNGSDIPSGLAMDSSNDVFLAGSTSSTNFPVANAYQPTVAPNQGGLLGNYGFITKFNPTESSLVYSTYLGGNSNVALNCGGTPCWPSPYSAISSIAVDGNGDAYVAGTTNTYNFPTTQGAYLTMDVTQLNGNVGFVSKFSSSGSLDSSTYFYESSGILTNIDAIAVDGSGSAYVTGSAVSDGTFPITSTNVCDPSVYGWGCGYAFVTKFDPTVSTLLYSTFLGPNNFANPRAIALDANDDAYIVASTSSNTFGIVNGIEPYTSGSDLLLVEIDPLASTQLFATYLGGSADDSPAAISVDPSGDLYIAGSTDSTDFPVTQGVFQDMAGGNTDAFVLKIGPGSAPSVSMSPDSLQFTAQNLGATSQLQTILLRNMGSSSLSISSITSNGDFAETNDCATGVAAAGSCMLSVTFTPTAAGTRTGSILIQDSAAGSPHVINLSGTGSGPVVSLTPASLTFASQPLGTSGTARTVTLANTGNATLSVGGIQITGDFTQTNNCPGTLSSNSTCTISVTFTPTVNGARNGRLAINDNAQGNSQVVNLTGTGADFVLASSPNSDTLKAGNTATFQLAISPVGGAFTNIVKLSCSGAPNLAACSISPNSVTPNGIGGSATLTITTTASVAQLVPLRSSRDRTIYAIWIPLQGIGIFGMILVGSGARSRKLRAIFLLALMIAALTFMIGCAGGTGVTTPPQPGTTPGTYTIVVMGTSGALQHTIPVTLTVQ